MNATDKAFPIHAENHAGYLHFGLTVRDYVAIQAMTGLLAGISDAYSLQKNPMPSYESIAKDSYRMADAMIERSEIHEQSI